MGGLEVPVLLWVMAKSTFEGIKTREAWDAQAQEKDSLPDIFKLAERGEQALESDDDEFRDATVEQMDAALDYPPERYEEGMDQRVRFELDRIQTLRDLLLKTKSSDDPPDDPPDDPSGDPPDDGPADSGKGVTFSK